MAIVDSPPADAMVIPYAAVTDTAWFREDFRALLELLREGKIHPVVAERLPLAEARHAHELLESAASNGKLVLVPSATEDAHLWRLISRPPNWETLSKRRGGAIGDVVGTPQVSCVRIRIGRYASETARASSLSRLVGHSRSHETTRRLTS
jgi:hypothetical protein